MASSTHPHLSRGLREQLNVPKHCSAPAPCWGKASLSSSHGPSKLSVGAALLSPGSKRGAAGSCESVPEDFLLLHLPQHGKTHFTTSSLLPAPHRLDQGSFPLCPQALLGAVPSTIPCWVKPRVCLAPWHKAPGKKKKKKSKIHSSHQQRAEGALSPSKDQPRWHWKPHPMICDTPAKDGTPTHLSSLPCPPQLWVLETPKKQTEEFWDLWMFLHLFVNAANPKLARRSGRIICQLLVSSAILKNMSQIHWHFCCWFK